MNKDENVHRYAVYILHIHMFRERESLGWDTSYLKKNKFIESRVSESRKTSLD